MLNFAVCDDDPIHLNRLCRVVEAHTADMAHQIYAYSSPEALLGAIEQHGILPNVCFLDIQMPHVNGIDLAKKLHSCLPQCAIIFVTSFLNFATDVYETPHVYFILKNELEQRMDATLELALSHQNPPQFLHYATASGFRNVPCEQVLYLERVLRKTRIVFTDGSDDLTHATASELIPPHCQSKFIRCHQSFWVHYAHVRTMERDCFYLPNQIRIPISRTYRDAARAQFFSCMDDASPIITIPPEYLGHSVPSL